VQVGEASGDIIRDVGYSDGEDTSYEDALLALAKAVANATANLVLKAKAVANNTAEQELQNSVISSATQCALATSQLVGCTKVILLVTVERMLLVSLEYEKRFQSQTCHQ